MIRSNYIYIYIYIYISVLSVFISAQEVKEWKEIPCAGIEKLYFDNGIWGVATGTTQYIVIIQGDTYKFTANGNKATLKEYPVTQSSYVSCNRGFYLEDETIGYSVFFSNTLSKIYLDKGNYYCYDSDSITLDNGQCFLMNNTHYFLDYENNKLYQLELIDTNEKDGNLNTTPLGDKLEYTPIPILSIVVVKNKFYYLSENGFCEVSISGNNVTYELIPSVTGMDETSILVTDNQSKIWIMNSASGVIEYDTTNKNATKVAEFPGNERDVNFNQVCFYSNGYLYYLNQDAKVYSLNLSGGDNPNNKTKWEKIPYNGIDNIDSIYNIYECGMGDSQYILAHDKYQDWPSVYQFTINGNSATFEDLECQEFYISPIDHPYLADEHLIHNACDETIGCFNIEEKKKIKGYEIKDNSEDIFFGFGKCFLMENAHYFLSHNNWDEKEKKLYKLELTEPTEEGESGTITATPCDALKYAPNYCTSIVVLKDTLYYFSDSGFCAVKVAGTTITSELISSVTVTDKVSILVTDNKERIWIINETDGVLEYNTKTKEIKTIDIFPFFTNDNRGNNNTTAVFYSKEHLYCITNKQMYSLDLKQKDNPVNPKKPLKPWIGPIAPMIEGGYEFKGLAEFFGMYFSILCNGIPMMFAFDPKMRAFNLAPKAPQFDPANMNNAFMNDRFFYIYNADRNTITCTDTMTGMSKEIACYENMPEDIIQIVVANNQFFILTKSGENHIAQMAGSNLKYVTSWTLDGWTPRTGASIATVKNAIYVFGGKAISEDSKEESGTCYNELYVYDFNTGSSEKLAVDSDVTARYDAKLLASKRWGKLWIICGKDASDSTASDVWEYNTFNQEWTYINDLPTKDGNASASYDEESDNLSLCITPEETTESKLFSSHPKMHKASKNFSSRAKTRKASRAFSSHAKTRENSKNFSSRAKTRDIFRASSGAVIYQIKDLSVPENAKDQSGKSCGCLGLEFILILAGLCFLRKSRK